MALKLFPTQFRFSIGSRKRPRGGWRKLLRGANTLAVILLVAAVLIVVNALASYQQKRWDFSESKSFTLAPRTIELLEGLTKPVTIYAFIRKDSDNEQKSLGLLETYQVQSPYLQYRIIDPDQHPAEAKEFGITQYDNIVVKTASGRQARGAAVTEAEITGALLRALREQGQSVYFLEGHGEHQLTDSLKQGYSELRSHLEREGYTPKSIRMLNGESVPTDAAALVVPGPKLPLLPVELDSIRRYLDGGGRLALLADPVINTGFEPMLNDWGITLGPGVVVDHGSRTFGGSFTLPLVTIYSVHEIVRELKLPTLFAEARPVLQDNSKGKFVGMALAQTSNQSWAELTPSVSPPQHDEGREQRGPFALAIAATPRDAVKDIKGSPRLVVVGDSDFMSNLYFNFSGNRDLFLNMVNWLVQGLDTFTVRPHETNVSPIILSEQQSGLLFVVPVIILPLAVMCTGWTVWWYRRTRL